MNEFVFSVGPETQHTNLPKCEAVEEMETK